jgi:hypothetical protein
MDTEFLSLVRSPVYFDEIRRLPGGCRIGNRAQILATMYRAIAAEATRHCSAGFGRHALRVPSPVFPFAELHVDSVLLPTWRVPPRALRVKPDALAVEVYVEF